MKKTKNKVPQKSSSKKVVAYRSVLFIVAGVIMLILVPYVFQIANDSFAPNCVTRTASGPCGLDRGFQAVMGAMAISVIWTIGAVILFIRGVASRVNPAK